MRKNVTATSVNILSVLAAGALLIGASACAGSPGGALPADERPVIAATTNILGDIVSNIVGDSAEVLVLMPAGADPHSFQLSTSESAKLYASDLVVENGLGLEQSIVSHIEAAESDGIAVVSVGEHVSPLPVEGDDGLEAHEHDGHEHGAHDSHEQGADDHEESHGDHDREHSHGGYDPHFWHDPQRMMVAVTAIESAIIDETELDAATIRANADAYRAALETLDQEMEASFAEIPAENRLLVSQHEVFGYLADRFGLRVVGSIVPSASTLAEASAVELAGIAEAIAHTGAPAIFTDSSQSDKLARVVAAEAGPQVQVIALHSESLTPRGGDAETYLQLMRSNTEAIVAGLGS